MKDQARVLLFRHACRVLLLLVVLVLLTMTASAGHGGDSVHYDDNIPAKVQVDDSSPAKTIARAQLLDGAASSNASGQFSNVISISYAALPPSSGIPPLPPNLCETATLYYTLDGSQPSRDSPNKTMDGTAPTPGPTSSRTYRVTLDKENLTGTNGQVRFIVEVSEDDPAMGCLAPDSPTDAVLPACDFGQTNGTPLETFWNAPCPKAASAPLDQSYRYLVDKSRPAEVASSQQPALVSGKSYGITNTDRPKIVSVMTGGEFRLSPFVNTRINQSGIKIFVNNIQRYGPGAADPKGTVTAGSGETFTYEWVMTASDDPLSDAADGSFHNNITWTASDYAGNPVAPDPDDRAVVRVDTQPPRIPLANITVYPAKNTSVDGVIVTGLGVSVQINATILEGNMNTTNRSAVKIGVVNETLGIFINSTDVYFDDVNTTANETHWKANVTLPTTITASAPFFVNVTVVANDTLVELGIDPTSHTAQATKPKVFQVDPVAPTFVLFPPSYNNVTGFIKNGPYTFRANATDTGGNVSNVFLVVQNSTGRFTSATGWTQLPSTNDTWFLPMTFVAPGKEYNYEAQIPNQTDNATLRVHVNATDPTGNVGNSTISQLVVDRKAPFLSESDPRIWRSHAPHTLTFPAVDQGNYTGQSGSGVNGTQGSAKLYSRIKGNSTYNFANMSLANNILSATLSNEFSHLTVIEYYVEAFDLLDNVANTLNGTTTKNFTIDLVAPTLQLLPVPSTSATGSFPLVADARDADSGIGFIIFQARFKSPQGTPGDWVNLQNSSSPVVQALCLPAGLTYEFRAWAIDVAGNSMAVPDSPQASSTVTAPGCLQTVTISIQQPAPGSTVDAQGGSGVKLITYTATPSGSLSSSAFLKIKIEFSPNNGKTYVTLASDLGNTGSYVWHVVAPSCTECRIRVTAKLPDGNATSEVSLPFRIINGSDTTDLDGNGLFDNCELTYFRDLGVAVPNADPDGDGLTTRRECALGTNPTATDTDGDGVSDGAEVKVGTNPVDAQSVPTPTQLRYQQWSGYFFVLPVLFVGVTAAYLFGIARRW